MRLIWLVAAVLGMAAQLLPTVAAKAQLTQTSEAAPNLSARIDRAFEGACDKHKLEGASATVILPSGAVWKGTCGIAWAGTAVQTDHLFEIGSITKSYTGALLLDLAAAGHIGLDDPVARYLPDVADLGGVTVKQLIQHTSGLYDVLDHPAYLGALRADPAKTWTARELIERFNGPPTAKPGEKWDYGNVNYLLLGMIAEKVTGNSYAKLVRSRILDRHGLKATWVGGFEEEDGPVAHAFIDITGDGEPEDLTLIMPPVASRTASGAAGAILASASDTAQWMRLFASQQAAALLSGRASWAWQPRGDGLDYGVGIMRRNSGNLTLLGHDGNTGGYSAAAWHEPQSGITVAVLSNTHLANLMPLSDHLIRAALATE